MASAAAVIAVQSPAVVQSISSSRPEPVTAISNGSADGIITTDLGSTAAAAAAALLPGETTTTPTGTTTITTAAGYEAQDVRTSMNYYKAPEDGSPPHPTIFNKPETFQRPTTATDVTVHDVRGQVGDYTLDKNGFQYCLHVSVEKDFTDHDVIQAVYYPEIEQLLRDVTGATRVLIFDTTLRGPSPPGEDVNAKTVMYRKPVQLVHVDQSYASSRSRVPHHLPDEADRLLAVRHQIINIWRPVRRAVRKDPFAVLDAASVPDADLVPIGMILPNRRGETLAVHANPAHRWCYLADQGLDEVLLLKCYDSKLDGRARRSPHSAFADARYADAEERESVELRALVFHEDDTAE